MIILYALIAFGAEGKKPELSQAIALFLAANGVTASIRLFVVVFASGSLGVLSQTDRLYLAVGAIAAMWISLGTIGRTFADVAPSEESPEEGANK